MKFRARFLAVTLLVLLPEQAGADRVWRKGAVATANPVASAAAVEMLDKGGNAIDAAVAAAFALAVARPFSSGLGGGGFALVADGKTGAVEALDFREVAPRGASRDMFVRDGKAKAALSQEGALSVAVPGAVAGYFELLAKKGKLKPEVVLAPAIRIAKDGFLVTARYEQSAKERQACVKLDPETAGIFLHDGEPPLAGTVLKQPQLAATLELLVKQGPKAFYAGPLGKAAVETVRAGGGVLSVEDLAGYKVRWRKPLEGTYRGRRVATMPPPSSGGIVVLQGLEGLEKFGGLPERDPEVLHKFVELLRRAFVDRTRYLGDPDFVSVPTEKLISREYVDSLVASIDPAHATPSSSLLPTGADGGFEHNFRLLAPMPTMPDKKHTTHISVIDADGNAVALTTTINYLFGSCLVAKGTGILLNDEMDDFAAQPMVPNAYGLVSSEANAVAPGKVPLSSMSPTFVFAPNDPKRVMLAVGAPGGSTIPTTVIQVISNVIDGPMDVTRAVGFGRIHHQYAPDAILVDRFGLEPATQKALEAKGHKIQRTESWGDPQAVMRDPVSGLFSAGSDPRGDGVGAGRD